MKRILTLFLAGCLCCGCAALPAEERSFAVALGISGGAGGWTLHARIPTYQTGGGYATVTGEGETLSQAMAALDAAAPLEMHLGQLRLLIIARDTAVSADFPAVLAWLGERHDLRTDAALAVTASELPMVMEALKPSAGTRLSKSLDQLLQTRIAQGSVLPATLAELIRMGERQQGALMNATLEDGAILLAGCWPLGADGRVREMLTAKETQLLALMTGRLRQGTLSLEEGVIRLTDAAADAELSWPTMQQSSVRLTLHTAGSPFTKDALARVVATACLGVLNRLSALGCDALGLARQAIVHVGDMAQWRELDWPARYREMTWSVSVGVEEAIE